MPQKPINKIVYYFLSAIIIIFLFYFGKLIATGDDMVITIGIAIIVLLLFFFFDFELFILLTLIINQEFFYLVPREPLETAMYQDLLFIVLPLALAVCLLKRVKIPLAISLFIFTFFVIIFIAVLNSTQQGQPMFLGLKAAKGYYLLLFFFVFFSRQINVQRLTRMIVLTGVLLMILNNIQYISWGSSHIFQYTREVDVIRGGMLRFLMGDFFTIFAPLLALGVYLQQKKRWYLVAFIYMTATVFIQGQTRSVIFGMTLTTIILIFIAQRIRIKVFVGMLVIMAGFILVEPMLQETFIGGSFLETQLELAQKSGNVGIRYDAYDYYWGELSQNVVTGRGIWNDAFTTYNPEDMKYKNLHLSDIGIMSFLFHTGLIGLAWLIALLIWVYRVHFASFGRLCSHVNYGIVGYFIFSLATLATLNGMIHRFTIIYLALALAVMAQYDQSSTQTVTV